MVPMYLTAIRYQTRPGGPWKSALVEGNLSSIAESLDRQPKSPDTVFVEKYENGTTENIRVSAVRLPDGRVYDASVGDFIDEEEKAHA